MCVWFTLDISPHFPSDIVGCATFLAQGHGEWPPPHICIAHPLLPSNPHTHRRTKRCATPDSRVCVSHVNGLRWVCLGPVSISYLFWICMCFVFCNFFQSGLMEMSPFNLCYLTLNPGQLEPPVKHCVKGALRAYSELFPFAHVRSFYDFIACMCMCVFVFISLICKFNSCFIQWIKSLCSVNYRLH